MERDSVGILGAFRQEAGGGGDTAAGGGKREGAAAAAPVSAPDTGVTSAPVQPPPHTLRRTLTTWDLMALGVGGIIGEWAHRGAACGCIRTMRCDVMITRCAHAGAGIYVLTGQAAANYAGPAVVVSFALSAVACGLAALCYSELAAIIPSSGSAYACVSTPHALRMLWRPFTLSAPRAGSRPPRWDS